MEVFVNGTGLATIVADHGDTFDVITEDGALEYGVPASQIVRLPSAGGDWRDQIDDLIPDNEY